MGACIGRNNYKKFKWFINSLVIALGWSLLAHSILLYKDQEHMWLYIPFILVYVAGGIFPIILSGYHSYLTFALDGMTTNEQCKGKK